MDTALAHPQLGQHTRLGHFGTIRTLVLGLSRILFAALSAATVSAAPTNSLRDARPGHPGSAVFGLWPRAMKEKPSEPEPEPAADVVVLFITSIILVLLGGAFAGLTIALMGQDSIYLQVLSRDETEPQQKNAKRVYNLLQRGKHWVLVTLLLSNVIVNETLPVVLDRCLGGGVAAVVGSTVLIVIFGEVLPQSICVRYGLQIGGIMAKPVLALMWLLAPIAWPTAKLLDRALGEDHGTVYKKSGLKTLVTLHHSLGEVSERLNQDEVTIISAVLDLKGKPVSSVMTPMDDVFTMSEDTVLDEEKMDLILSAGYSRIPIHEPGNPTNFVGMLLVKILITYDPDDKNLVSEFPLATLPETRPETSCLDIVNFFQEGKSHMVLVSQFPGEDHGALGVVTLEDVIEELIGEEIIDESDVYIDVHKAIRRLQPAPRARPMRHKSLVAEMKAANATAAAAKAAHIAGEASAVAQVKAPSGQLGKEETQALSTSPKMTTLLMRRRSAGLDGRLSNDAVPVRTSVDDMWQHLRHLGPSNPATNPKNTRSTTVKIKAGTGAARNSWAPSDAVEPVLHENAHEDDGEDDDETTHLLKPTNSSDPRDRSRSPHSDYGARGSDRSVHGTVSPPKASSLHEAVTEPAATESHVEEAGSRPDTNTKDTAETTQSTSITVEHTEEGRTKIEITAPSSSAAAAHRPDSDSGASGTSGQVPASEHSTAISHHTIVRSGSITENVIETRGIRKVILETNSSAEDEEEEGSRHHLHISGARSPAISSAAVSDVEQEAAKEPEPSAATASSSSQAAASSSHPAGKKKNRRKKRKGSKA